MMWTLDIFVTSSQLKFQVADNCNWVHKNHQLLDKNKKESIVTALPFGCQSSFEIAHCRGVD